MLSVRSYLGRSLDDDALEEERRYRTQHAAHLLPLHPPLSCLCFSLSCRLSLASQGLDDSFRRRRDSRISVSGSFQTPEFDVPISQFGQRTQL